MWSIGVVINCFPVRMNHRMGLNLVEDRGKKTKYQHHYYDDYIVENLARYFKVNKDLEILALLKKLRRNGY